MNVLETHSNTCRIDTANVDNCQQNSFITCNFSFVSRLKIIYLLLFYKLFKILLEPGNKEDCICFRAKASKLASDGLIVPSRELGSFKLVRPHSAENEIVRRIHNSIARDIF